MKCKDCDCCHSVTYTRRNAQQQCMQDVNVYECLGVKEPFEITDINRECTEYPEKRTKVVGCSVCSNDYHQEIKCYLMRFHSGDNLSIDKIETKFCPNCGRKF